MPIKKQEFYEGAALHLLARSGRITSLTYDSPFFLLNNQKKVLLKYSTKSRSPWGFTFNASEQSLMAEMSRSFSVWIGLICGSDGIATIDYSAFMTITDSSPQGLHIACFRKYDEHYEISGPRGTLKKKIPPSMWRKLLNEEQS